jgi:transposase
MPATPVPSRKPYPSDVSDDEWAFVAPYLALLPEDAGQREHPLREVFDALRWLVRTGSPWRYLPNDLPPWEAVYQQTQRWIRAGVFEQMAHDLRQIVRQLAGRAADPSAAILDGRTLQSTPESGGEGRAGYDGAKKRKGSKAHIAVDTLGHLLAVVVTPANEQERAQVAELARAVQEATGQSVELAWVDQGYTGKEAEQAAAEHGIRLEVVKLPEARKGFVLLPRRWVVERSFAWAARFRRLARDYERLPGTLAGYHWLVFVVLMLGKAGAWLAGFAEAAHQAAKTSTM